MIEMLYQAKAGDGFKKVGMKRAKSFFSSPQDAVSEAFALKEKMDLRYKNKIEWDYNTSITRSNEKLRILRGYLGGNRENSSFYLEILSVEALKDSSVVSPKKPKKLSTQEKKVVSRVKKYLASN